MNELDQSAVGDMSPSVAMLQMVRGFWVSRAIYVAADLGLADLLKDEPKSSEELAQATATHAPSLYRLMRALASVGIFAQDEQGRFALTPVGATLQTDVPSSLRAWVLLQLGEEYYRASGDVMHTCEQATLLSIISSVWEFGSIDHSIPKQQRSSMKQWRIS
jgi:hypothetical protein